MPEYIYKIEANPRSESLNDRFFPQAYLPQEDGTAKIGDVLYIGTPKKCRELMEQAHIRQEQICYDHTSLLLFCIGTRYPPFTNNNCITAIILPSVAIHISRILLDKSIEL